LDYIDAGNKADELISAEIAKQDRMWGVAHERADSEGGELMLAGMAQLDALFDRIFCEEPHAFAETPDIFPECWSGFRDYGSDVANLVVAIAYLRQEVKRLIAGGADTTRTSRNPDTQPYTADQPAVVEA
jgi:hypothetical protein